MSKKYFFKIICIIFFLGYYGELQAKISSKNQENYHYSDCINSTLDNIVIGFSFSVFEMV